MVRRGTARRGKAHAPDWAAELCSTLKPTCSSGPKENFMQITKERTFSPHHTFLGAARVSLELARSRQPGSHYHELTAIVMSALSIEALANAIGARVMTDWKDFESSSPWAKLRLLCEALHVAFDRSVEPWSTMKWLCGFRNKAAHAKPEDLLEVKQIPDCAYEQERSEWPESSLEHEITLGNATRAYEAIQQVKLVLFKSMPSDTSGGIFADGAMFSGTRYGG